MEVIILGSGGGPREDITTAFLVRSVSTGWKRNSLLAVDAGSQLAAITRILEKHSPIPSHTNAQNPTTLTSGPFKDLEVSSVKPVANAAHITRNLIDTYLITHPHLDHIYGFVTNTASLLGARPKRLAGLPNTIEAFRNHIFNDVIWPNLSDENNGAGLVTYMRLVEGGSPAIGEGDSRGYVEVCEGLVVKTLSVSHGHAFELHNHGRSTVGLGTSFSLDTLGRSTPVGLQASPRINSGLTFSSADSMISDSRGGGRVCVCDSSAYFIRDIASGDEIIIFGDVEPDSISLSPRNINVWIEAAPKIASGLLKGIFIECSYDDSQSDDRLFGHLAPRFLIEELKALATEVQYCGANNSKDKTDNKKRKRLSNSNTVDDLRRRTTRASVGSQSPISPLTRSRFAAVEIQSTEEPQSLHQDSTYPVRGKNDFPLKGLKVVIIHVKDKLDDGPEVGDVVLEQLLAYEEEAKLGCEFIISKSGEAVYF